MNVVSEAANSHINLGSEATVENAIINAIINVAGNGMIRNATVNVDGVTFERNPENFSNPNENSNNRNGIGGGSSSGGNSGGNNGGNNGGSSGPRNSDDHGNSEQALLNEIRLTNNSIELVFSKTVTGETYGDFVVTARLDGEPFVLDGLSYDETNNRFTFTPLSLGEYYGKTLTVTVSATENNGKFVGSRTAVLEFYGFSGRITDVNGIGVANMTIKFRSGNGNTSGEIVGTTVTDQQGYYTIFLPRGVYTGELVAPGFITTYLIAVSADEYNRNENATAIRVAGANEIRIVLSWGEHPRDLDSHLVGPTPNGSRFHTWWAEREYEYYDVLYADLDHDDIDSYGPETTTIRQVLDGKYRFFVHNYSGEQTLRTSGAKVEVYLGESTTPAKVYHVPTGDGTERYWAVFEMEVNGEDISFNDINKLVNTVEEASGGYVEESPEEHQVEFEAELVYTNSDERDSIPLYEDTVARVWHEVHQLVLWVRVGEPGVEVEVANERKITDENGEVSFLVDLDLGLNEIPVNVQGNTYNLKVFRNSLDTFNVDDVIDNNHNPILRFTDVFGGYTTVSEEVYEVSIPSDIYGGFSAELYRDGNRINFGENYPLHVGANIFEISLGDERYSIVVESKPSVIGEVYLADLNFDGLSIIDMLEEDLYGDTGFDSKNYVYAVDMLEGDIITVTGSVYGDVDILINGDPVTVDSNGSFTKDLHLLYNRYDYNQNFLNIDLVKEGDILVRYTIILPNYIRLE